MDGLRRFDAAPSMTDRVAASLREAITSLQLTPGSPIVEATVARQLGVSTTPVREALHRLAKDGLVVLNRHRGASVVTMSTHDIDEIYQMREALEPLAVRLSVPHFTEAEIAAMGALLNDAGEAIIRHDWDALSHCNREYHGMFIARCGNDRLRSVLENLQDQNRIIALLTWHNRGYQAREHEEHLAILEEVRRRDAEAAASSALQHLTRFGQSIVEAWSGFSARPTVRDEVLR
ncbi:MAG: GntR family transcriptional regulator [Thermomicrobiales bacterium]